LSPTAAVNEEEQVPLTFALLQNYPNPFNPSTQIDYCIPQATHVTLFIYNMNGRLVKQLVNEQQKEGRYRITWDGKNDTHQHVVSGTYLYRLQAGESTAVHKMVLLK
ncbi:T9SS type A sorting domain-containing protein, partial [candidate division KSB1 bacterium]|nr:T9SS type A sorting domain-containing protein [candidate division KSB1 bacterium]